MEQQEQDVAKAVVIIEEALRVAQSLPTPTDVRHGITFTATALAGIDPDRALALVEAAYQEPARVFAEADAEAARHTDPAAKVALYVEAARRCDCPISDDWVEAAAREPECFWPRIRDSAEQASRPDWPRSRGLVDNAVRAFPSRALEFVRRAGSDVSAATVRELAAADPDLALAVAREVQSEWTRVLALCEVMRAIGTTAPEKVDEIAREVLATARAAPHSQSRQDELGSLACAWGPANPEAARRLVPEIEGPAHQALALAFVAKGFAERDPARAVGVVDEALALLDCPSSGEFGRGREWQYGPLHYVSLLLGQMDLTRALEVAARTQHGYQRMLVLEKLLPLVCVQDQVLACAVLAELVRADYESCYSDERSAEGTVVRVLQRLWPEHADRIIEQLERLAPQWRGQTATSYVLRAIAAQDCERAVTFACEEEDESHRFWLLGQIAAAIAPEDLARAREVLALIAHPFRREQAAVGVVGAIAAADFEAARALTATLQHDQSRADALKHLAAVVIARDVDKAEAMLIESVTAYDEDHDRFFRSWAYTGVAYEAGAILARADAHKAVAMLRRVQDPEEHLMYLLSLAKKLLGAERRMTGEPEDPPLP